MFSVSRDPQGNDFVELGNLRITYIKASARKTSSKWRGEDRLGFNGYVGKGDSRKMLTGTEIPLGNNPARTVFRMISAIGELMIQNLPLAKTPVKVSKRS